MEIREVRKAKAALESQIRMSLEEFERNTDCVVIDMQFERIVTETSGSVGVVRVRAEV